MAIARQSKSPFFVKLLVHELGELCHHISSVRVLFTDTSDNTAYVEIGEGEYFAYWPIALVETFSRSTAVAAGAAGIWMPYRMRENFR
ncbi:hypothetical protein ABRQ03_08515 [Pectobacterium jejuense]|uniref:hypothetical protein n=1 Tax=Pectobacterium jejuense TaxID=2974022 RepID=UPI0032EE2492